MRTLALRYQILATLTPLAIAGAFFWFGVPMYRQAKASEHWPTVQGRVESARYESREEGVGENASTTHLALVEVSYEVNGQSHRRSDVQLGDRRATEAEQKEVVRRYPAGTIVTVYYNPQDPAVCELEPGVKSQHYQLIAGGCIFLVCFVVCVFVVYRQRKVAATSSAP